MIARRCACQKDGADMTDAEFVAHLRHLGASEETVANYRDRAADIAEQLAALA